MDREDIESTYRQGGVRDQGSGVSMETPALTKPRTMPDNAVPSNQSQAIEQISDQALALRLEKLLSYCESMKQAHQAAGNPVRIRTYEEIEAVTQEAARRLRL